MDSNGAVSVLRRIIYMVQNSVSAGRAECVSGSIQVPVANMGTPYQPQLVYFKYMNLLRISLPEAGVWYLAVGEPSGSLAHRIRDFRAALLCFYVCHHQIAQLVEDRLSALYSLLRAHGSQLRSAPYVVLGNGRLVANKENTVVQFQESPLDHVPLVVPHELSWGEYPLDKLNNPPIYSNWVVDQLTAPIVGRVVTDYVDHYRV